MKQVPGTKLVCNKAGFPLSNPGSCLLFPLVALLWPKKTKLGWRSSFENEATSLEKQW